MWVALYSYLKYSMLHIIWLLVSVGLAAAENGLNAWLRYAPLPAGDYSLPSSIITLNSTEGSPVYTAGLELQKGIQGVFGKRVSVGHANVNVSSSMIVATVDEYTGSGGNADGVPKLAEDGFWLSTEGTTVQILGQNERGALYGAFEYLSKHARGNFSRLAYATNSDA